MEKLISYYEVSCEGDFELEWRNGFDSKHLVVEVSEQGALEELRKVVCKHAQRGAVLDDEDTALDQIVQPEVSNIDVARLLGCWAAALDKLDGALVVLVHCDGWGIEAFAS